MANRLWGWLGCQFLRHAHETLRASPLATAMSFRSLCRQTSGWAVVLLGFSWQPLCCNCFPDCYARTQETTCGHDGDGDGDDGDYGDDGESDKNDIDEDH